MALKFNAFFMIFLNIFHKIISLLVYTKEQKLDGFRIMKYAQVSSSWWWCYKKKVIYSSFVKKSITTDGFEISNQNNDIVRYLLLKCVTNFHLKISY